MILGITGGTGCGKTTLLELIRDRGGLVLDCDKIYHDLLRLDGEMHSAIQARFPNAFEDNQLNRKKLGSIVFSDPEALNCLNQITHSAVRREVLRRLEGKHQHAAIDAIGLFEGDLASLCDLTVAVTAPVEDRVARLMARDGITEEYARARIRAQHEDAWFREKCDIVLENNTDRQNFTNLCLAFLDTYGILTSGNT